MTDIAECRPLTEAAAAGVTGERMLIRLITPGWGATGFYAADVLESAASAGVWPSGTQMFLDHPGRAETGDRPERSVRDLAGALTETARWDAAAQAVVAEARIFGPVRAVLAEMADDIGVSIRGTATVTEGEAEGRMGTIITEMVSATSVDFVTAAGRGGRVLEVLESARPAGAMTSPATASPVTAQTVYTTTTESEERQMPDPTPTGPPTTIVEATHLSRLEQTAGRVQTAEAAAETAARRVQAAEAAMATRVQAAEAATASAEARARAAETAMADMRTDLNTTTARQVVAEAAREAGVTLDRWQTIGLTNDMPLTDGGVVDRDEMRTRAAAAAAAILERGGAGVVHGFGGPTESPNLTEADLDEAISGISFTRTDNTKVSS
jgi:hypothetical protein